MTSAWLTVAVALIGACATLGGVIYTQRAAERREVRGSEQVASDRAFELQKAVQGAAWQNRQALLDRRIEAHAGFLEAAEVAEQAAYRLAAEESIDMVVIRRDIGHLDQMMHAHVRLQMFASDGAVAAAGMVCATVQLIRTDPSIPVERALAARDALLKYKAAMREDLRQP